METGWKRLVSILGNIWDSIMKVHEMNKNIKLLEASD